MNSNVNLDAELLKNANDSLSWLKNKFDEISKKFDHNFIAIKRNEIIASSTSYENLLSKLTKLNEDPSKILIKYIDTKPPILL